MQEIPSLLGNRDGVGIYRSLWGLSFAFVWRALQGLLIVLGVFDAVGNRRGFGRAIKVLVVLLGGTAAGSYGIFRAQGRFGWTEGVFEIGKMTAVVMMLLNHKDDQPAPKSSEIHVPKQSSDDQECTEDKATIKGLQKDFVKLTQEYQEHGCTYNLLVRENANLLAKIRDMETRAPHENIVTDGDDDSTTGW